MNKEYEIHENLTCASTSLTSLEKEVLLISWRDNDDAAPAVPDCLSKCSQILSGIVKWEFLMPSWFHEIIPLIFKIPHNSVLQNISCTDLSGFFHIFKSKTNEKLDFLYSLAYKSENNRFLMLNVFFEKWVGKGLTNTKTMINTTS